MKEVIDIQNLRVELDAEDQELMTMFPAHRRVLNDRLLVTDGEDCYLISKSWLAHRKKQMEDAVRGVVVASGIVLAFVAAACLVMKIGNSNGWFAVLSALSLIAGSLGLAREMRN